MMGRVGRVAHGRQVSITGTSTDTGASTLNFLSWPEGGVWGVSFQDCTAFWPSGCCTKYGLFQQNDCPLTRLQGSATVASILKIAILAGHRPKTPFGPFLARPDETPRPSQATFFFFSSDSPLFCMCCTCFFSLPSFHFKPFQPFKRLCVLAT